jgi:hypothetical protein
MSPRPRWPRRALALIGALLVVHVAGARALDALGLVESLLSPGGARLALVLPLAVLFFAARILLLFVAPGLTIAAVLEAWISVRRR